MAERRRVKAEPQAHMDEQIIADEDLLETIGRYLDNQEEHRTFMAAKRSIKDKMKDRGEGRYRVGEYVLDIKMRSGGGISIPDWESPVISVVAP